MIDVVLLSLLKGDTKVCDVKRLLTFFRFSNKTCYFCPVYADCTST